MILSEFDECKINLSNFEKLKKFSKNSNYIFFLKLIDKYLEIFKEEKMVTKEKNYLFSIITSFKNEKNGGNL